MENNEISVSQALNQIQSWINAGEFDKAFQGSKEILEIEPENKRALALMKQAEERRHATPPVAPAPVAPPVAPTPVTPAAPAVIPAPSMPTPTVETDPSLFGEDENAPREHPAERKKLLLAIFIPAILVVLVGGTLIWILANRQRNEVVTPPPAENSPTQDQSVYETRNVQRLKDLSEMAQILENYHDENGLYPAVGQVEEVILSNDGFEKIPLDPRHGELDETGREFGYIYAVYERNSQFILSALFEDDNGVPYVWTAGASREDLTDYRDLKKPFVHLLGEAKGSPKTKVRRAPL